MYIKPSYFDVMNEVKKDSQDEFAGKDFYVKIKYIISFPAI
jgi:hypothetical protein